MLLGDTDALQFRPIDIVSDAHHCIAFRRDSFFCSFGSDQEFTGEKSEEQYLQWLRERLSEWPESCVHVWDGETIIGQMEMRLRDQSLGYINLFYLVPEARGSGAGNHLQAYAERSFRQLGVTRVRLSVSPTNQRALAYYAKHGWRDLGPRPDKTSVNLMELVVEK